jgi:hypothetical protein
MPESKKRVKKAKNIVEPVYKNPLKSKWGKITVLILAIAFVAGLVLTTVVIMWQAIANAF